ncbi:MAG: TrmH family RNA methyltransferase [bacterium]|nr:TrmH family RNA methyltransferase [bacterium]
MIAILHNIRSVHNVGAIFRTADACGIGKLYLCGITPTPLDRFGRHRRDFAKTALGAEKTVLWEKVQSTTRLLDRLKKEGFRIFAVEQDEKTVSLFDIHVWESNSQTLEKAGVVVGDEVRGLGPALLKRADVILEIPMFGKKESLNVSVAFGVVAYRLLEENRK